MLVLHAAWIKEKTDGAIPCLFLWAESPEKFVNPPEINFSTAIGPSRIHPFAAPVRELRNLFDNHPYSHIAQVFYRSLAIETVIFAPSDLTNPLPSPQCLTAGSPLADAAVSLLPWKLYGLSFTPAETATLLPFFIKLATTPPTNALLGDDFTYLLALASFVYRILLEQNYVPGLAKHTHRTTTWYRPCWQPYLGETDDQLTCITQAMPEAFCHVQEYTTLTDLNYRRPDKKQIFTSFLNTMVNLCVKKALVDYKENTACAKPLATAEADAALTKLPDLLNNWLQLLQQTSNHSLQAHPKQAERLYLSLLCWQQGISSLPEQKQAFRTCLRLEEPADTCWRLNFFIHPPNDISLLLPADAVWSATTDTFTYFDQQLPNLQQKFLRDLALAAKLFSPIALALREACPTGVDLTTDDAYAFLSASTELLRQAGFGVIIPNWWRKETTPIKITIEAEEVPKSSLLGLNALAAYSLEATVGDQKLSLTELENIVAHKLPLVKMAGCWLEISPAQAAAALAMLQRRHNTNGLISLGRLLHYTTSDFDSDARMEPADSPTITVKATERLQASLRCLTGQQSLPELSPPPAFQGTLRPYQLRGMSWLCFLRGLGLGACLADDMGLGKTIQIIAYLLHNKEAKLPPAPTLVICPTSVLGNWRREIANFAPGLTQIIHHGSNRLTGDHFIQAAKASDIVISTYAIALRDEELFTALAWDNVILDEAQNIKNSLTKQTISINKLKAKCRIALTGTPVENRLSELWSIFHFINPGYLGTLIEFKQRYATPIERSTDQERQQTLQRLIKPFLLRRLKTDKTIIQDLPEKQETKIYCPLTREQATLYAAVLDDMLPQIEAATIFTRKALIAATLTKLKQVCNHPVHFLKDGSLLDNRSGKLTRLIEMLEELRAGNRRALIFTQYTQMGELLRQYLERKFLVSVPFLHGGLKQSDRDQLVTTFRDASAAPPFFILSLKAGGVGLNLTQADTVFHFDRWWNPAVENQATDRAFRIGQTKNVQVYKFICPGTLEELIDTMIENKKILAENVVGTGESWLNELSTIELKNILALRAAELEEE